ncbi:MAG TPA: hypothetical protein VET27_09255 [Mycobacterium sp.]|nr:hypothetical protein [Mycobacterium sp.]
MADAGVDGVNLHHREWTADLTALFPEPSDLRPEIARTPALSAFPPDLLSVLLGNDVFFHELHRGGAVLARANWQGRERVGQRT